MAAEVKWVKITTDMFDNRKIKYLRRLPDGNNIVLIWVMLLTLAGRCNYSGTIFLTPTVPYSSKILADELGFKEATVRAALQALEQLSMISTDKEGFITVTGWDEHQNIDGMEKIRESKRMAQARWRANKASTNKSTVDSNVDTTVDTTVDACSISVDDAEEEREREEEKEYSFYLSKAKSGMLKTENVENHVENSAEKQKLMGGALGKGVVFLSDEQIDDLLEKLSTDEFDRYVSVVADCELKGKHFGKSHYQAILDMAEADRRKGRKAK